MKAAKSVKNISSLNTVFIGGIPLDTSRSELLEYLKNFDQVLNLDVAKDKKTKQCKGFAKAVLRSSEGVDRLIAAPAHYIRGLQIGVKRWTNKSEYLKRKDEISKRKIYVRHHPSFTKYDLELHFSVYGTVVAIDEKIDHETGQPRNFAYVTFESEKAAHLAANFGMISDKSQYIYCELTIPSYLMPVDSKASPCVSPTFRVPTKSTKQATLQSFGRIEASYNQLGSLVFDQGQNDSVHHSKMVKKYPNRGSDYVLDHHRKTIGSHQVLISQDVTPHRKRCVGTCQELNAISPTRVNHVITPTSRMYISRVDANHVKENLVFYGPSKSSPLARLVFR